MTSINSDLSQATRDVLTHTCIPWGELKDSTVLIFGATGLVGGALVRALSAANAKLGLSMRIIALGRSGKKGDALAREYNTEFIEGDICNPSFLISISGDSSYIFHCAAMTKSSDMTAKPVDVITTMVNGTRNVLEFARMRQCRSVVYLSSMEVYGQTDKREVREGDLGYIDLLAPRSSYPESKRLCEMLCASYHAQYGVPVKIARLAQTFGVGTPKDDTRVFAQFARSAMSGEDIELHTQGASRGNYCCISDTVGGLLTLLLKGKNGEAYNIATPSESRTIREMAELVADTVAGGKIKVMYKAPGDLQQHGYAPVTGYTLNVDKLKALGWKPKYGLAEMYERMIADWRDS